MQVVGFLMRGLILFAGKCDDLLSLCVAGGVAGQDIKEKKLKKMFPEAARINIEENKRLVLLTLSKHAHVIYM